MAISIIFDVVFDIGRAHAQNAEAEKLFNDGNNLMTMGRLAEACAAFEASNRTEPRAGTLLRLGECRENNQQIASAWSAYKDAQRLAIDPRKHKFAVLKVTELEPRLSYLTVAVSEQIRVSGLELTRNGKPFEQALWNNALPVDGGTYIIASRAPGYKAWQRTVHVPAEGGKLSVDVPVLTRNSGIAAPQVPLPTTSPNPPVASPTPAVTTPVTTTVQQNVNVAAPSPAVVVVPTHAYSHAPSRTSSMVAPFIAGAGALALLGGGLGFELWAESRYAAAKSEVTSQARRESLYNSANRKRYIAEGFAASGIAVSGLAVWLYLRGGNRERDRTTGVGVHVAPMATSTSLALTGQF